MKPTCHFCPYLTGMLLHLVFSLTTMECMAEDIQNLSVARSRVIVTTDGEIDDVASMIRFLLNSNEFDIEGIINSSSDFHWLGGKGWNHFNPPEWIEKCISDYAKVYPNLTLHDLNYPSPEYLISKWRIGNISSR